MIFRYPSICIFSTGDEIGNGQGTQIRDTNSVMIKQILEQDNYMGKVFLTGVAKDKCVHLYSMSIVLVIKFKQLNI